MRNALISGLFLLSGLAAGCIGAPSTAGTVSASRVVHTVSEEAFDEGHKMGGPSPGGGVTPHPPNGPSGPCGSVGCGQQESTID